MDANLLLGIVSVLHLYALAAVYSLAELLVTIYDYFQGHDKTYYMKKVRSSGKYKKGKKIALVTGGAGAIGRKIVEYLLDLEYEVYVMGHGVDDLRHLGVSEENICEVDMADCIEVSRCLQRWSKSMERVTLLFACHGVMACGKDTSNYGIEKHMAVNFLSNVFLINTILQKFGNSNCRMIFLSSATLHAAHLWDPQEFSSVDAFRRYRNGYHSYALSKYCLSRYIYLYSNHTDRTIDMVSVHPGIVPTALYNNVNILWRFFIQSVLKHVLWTPSTAALKLIEAAHSDLIPGAYYEYGRAMDSSFRGKDDANFMRSVQKINSEVFAKLPEERSK
uniref:Epimerase domain-containing protein n=1 Tax=Steinernema glaseri TaxID=37863 RepID=A0A1I8ASG7_9BILA